MDPLRSAIAVGPLAAYLMLLGLVNLRRRPFLTTGGRDHCALAVAIAGIVTVGPLELFMPASAAAAFGVYVWPLLLALYAMCASLAILYSRPRIVIYNISREELRPLLGRLAALLDAQARWAGDNVFLPNLHVQLHIEPYAAMRNVSLIATGDDQSLIGWRQLERQLSAAARELCTFRNWRGIGMFSLGFLLSCTAIWQLTQNPQLVQQSLDDFLWL